jgi:hypothetical protein
MALDIDGDREAGDVGGHGFGMHGEGGDGTTETQRADAQCVNSFQYISLKFGGFGVGARFSCFP